MSKCGGSVVGNEIRGMWWKVMEGNVVETEDMY